MKPKQRKYGKLLSNLNYDFITRSLERLVNFLTDDAQGSLVGGHTNPFEMKFLRNIANTVRSENILAVFDERHQRLLHEICKLIEGANFKMRTTVNKRKGCPKEILYIKVPRLENSKQQREISHDRPSCNKPPRLEDPNPQMGRPWYPKIEVAHKHQFGGFVHQRFLNTHRHHAAHFTVTNYGASTSQAARIPTIITNRDRKYSAPNINFQAGSLMAETTCEADPLLTEAIQRYKMFENILEMAGRPIEPKPYQPQPKRCRSMEVKPYSKDQQLLAALSVPVCSDKALKMMMGMGWTGGALGPRGNGITEPIMPHLRNHTAAGLGHTKAVQAYSKQIRGDTCEIDPNCDTSKRTTASFRKMLLRSMLDLLNSNDLTLTLNFQRALGKKEQGFLKNAVTAFARKTKIQLADDEQPLADELTNYANELQLTMTACISNDGRKILLEKKYGVLTLTKGKIKSINFILDKDPERAMHQILDKYGAIFQTQALLEKVQFKIKSLLQLLILVKDKNEKQINIIVKEELTTKQKNYLQFCINGINRRNRFGSTKAEFALSLEIIRNVKVGVYALRIEFREDMKSFTVIKDYGKATVHVSVPQEANLASSGDNIDYFSSDNDDDMTDNNEDKMIKQISKINDATENNDNELEVKIENGSQINKNDDLEPQVVKEPGLNTSELAKAIEKENIDEEIKTEENIPKSDISIVDVACDDMSMTENSGFTDNLDYNETDEIDINMISDDGTNSDKKIDNTLDLSNISLSTLNVENGSKIIDLSFIIVYLTKQCDVCEYMPKYIQGIISDNIMQIKEKNNLPLLKCHGLHNHFLIYSCHTRKSYDWLQNMCVANKITICTKEFDKMSLKIKTFYDFNEKCMFDLLEMYNEKICTKEWSILKKESLGDYVIFDVKMDKNSIKSVFESNFELYAGVDKVTFCFIWE